MIVHARQGNGIVCALLTLVRFTVTSVPSELIIGGPARLVDPPAPGSGIYSSICDYAKAESLYQRARKIREKAIKRSTAAEFEHGI